VPQLDRDGVRIHYEVAGEGPAIVLTHGFAASAQMFAANIASVARDHTVVTWDLRGHGASDYPDDPAAYAPALAVADLGALLDAVGAERAVVGGHSLGGYLSLAFHLAHPERVEALILIDTGPGYRSAAPRRAWNEMCERYAADLERRGLGGLPGSDELNAVVHRDATGLVVAARHLLPQYDDRVLASLPTIGVPTLVVVGDRDEPFLAPSKYMAAKIPGARLVVIPGAGHAPGVSHAEEFDTALRTFLDSVGPGTATRDAS
jgi:pimeloyl-ACP methyl ester carboxylesterase